MVFSILWIAVIEKIVALYLFLISHLIKPDNPQQLELFDYVRNVVLAEKF